MTFTVGSAVVTRAAPAKINLYLHITGRRSDGFHLLDSLVAFADAGDRIGAGPADDLLLTVDGPFAPALVGAADNLVLRAARQLALAGGIQPHAHLRLTKNLPVASGIGGGSTDAAATLSALCELWRLDPGAAELDRIALSLGSDVPVCLRGRPQHLSGAGEILHDVPAMPTFWFVLVNPGIPLLTADIFRARRGGFSAAAGAVPATGNVHDLAHWLRGRRNDLEAVARFLAPEVDAVLAQLSVQPDCLLARMSGSGATCFGLFADQVAAQRAASAIRLAQPDWWVMAAAHLAAPEN